MVVIDRYFDRSDLIVDTDPSLSDQTDPTVKSERHSDHFEFRTRKFSLRTLKSVLIKWRLKSQVYLHPGSEPTFESLETISGPISWFECSIRVPGTQ